RGHGLARGVVGGGWALAGARPHSTLLQVHKKVSGREGGLVPVLIGRRPCYFASPYASSGQQDRHQAPTHPRIRPLFLQDGAGVFSHERQRKTSYNSSDPVPTGWGGRLLPCPEWLSTFIRTQERFYSPIRSLKFFRTGADGVCHSLIRLSID